MFVSFAIFFFFFSSNRHVGVLVHSFAKRIRSDRLPTTTTSTARSRKWTDPSGIVFAVGRQVALDGWPRCACTYLNSIHNISLSHVDADDQKSLLEMQMGWWYLCASSSDASALYIHDGANVVQ